MKTSETIGEIVKALAKCQAVLKNPTKDGNNTHFKSKYATLAGVLDAIREPATANGLSFVSAFDEDNTILRTRVLHISGEWIEDNLKLVGTLSTMQQLGAAITYGRRYSLQSLFGVTGEEDDDGNSISLPPKPQTPRYPQPQQQQQQPNANSLAIMRTSMAGAFLKLGINQNMLEDYLAKPINEANQSDINHLRSLYQDIATGKADVVKLFGAADGK